VVGGDLLLEQCGAARGADAIAAGLTRSRVNTEPATRLAPMNQWLMLR